MAKFMGKAELTFAALEVGTAPMRDVFNALRKDNWLHLQKKPDRPRWEAIKGEIRAAFYPETQSWKDKVWQHAAETVEPALASLG
jgi:hypothetical protein